MRKRKCFLYFLLLYFFLPVFPTYADNNGTEGNLTALLGRPLQSQEIREVVNKIKDVQKGIDAISAVAYQRKKTPLLAKEIATEGTIILKRPNLLHWEVKSPERITIIVDGKIMWIYHPDSQEAQKYILSEQFIARQVMEFFSSAMDMSLEEMGKRFDVAVYNPNTSFVFEMRPKSSMAAKYLTAVYIWYKNGEGVPYKFEVLGKNGNTTIMELRDVVVNPSLKESLFYFDVPAEAIITNRENEGMGY